MTMQVRNDNGRTRVVAFGGSKGQRESGIFWQQSQ